jgi:inner membrane protein
MATPLGHYLVGLSVTQGLARDSAERKRGLWLATIACLPDLDVIPGLFVGRLAQFHHGVSHSFAAAAIFSIATWFFFRQRDRASWSHLTSLVFLLYASHVVLDFFTLDTGAPYGVPLFWPLSHESYQSSWLLLPNVQHTRAPLVSAHNIWLAAREGMIFLPLIGFIRALKHPKTAWRLRHAWFFGGWFILALWASVLSLHQG